MVKPISRLRREYAHFYRCLRQTKGARLQRATDEVMQEAIDCAVLTYDYFGSTFDGWINRQRMSQFHNRMHLIMFTGSIPF